MNTTLVRPACRQGKLAWALFTATILAAAGRRSRTVVIALLLAALPACAQWYFQTEVGAVGLQAGQHGAGEGGAGVDMKPLRLYGELPALSVGHRIFWKFGAAAGLDLREVIYPLSERHPLNRVTPVHVYLTYGLTRDRNAWEPFVLAYGGMGYEISYYDSGEGFVETGVRAEWPVWGVLSVGADLNYSTVGLAATLTARLDRWWLLGR